MKVKICKHCENTATGATENKEHICIICFSKEFVEITINPEEIHCIYCGKIGREYQKELPFYSHKDKTFYCGCLGWG